MRKSHILLYIVVTLLGLITINNNVSALSYSTDVNIGFTFNPTISLSISPDNLTVSNLTPGTAAESNTITINVATNAAYGYHLTANVGSDTTNYNTTNLVHAPSATSTPTSNATFTSLAYGSSVANKDNLSPNTWGYSYSNDSGATWRPYSGLPLYSDINHSANLISTYTAADSKSIELKIAASASNTQPSGDYTNIINFYATSVPEPPLLYDVVEGMTKGTLAENNVKLSDPITQANSGVYTYDPTVYGTASDASNDYNVYFYRGILDSNLDGTKNTYGSNGDGKNYPNYVKLGDTCWRIVRTTGSGGTKMIYNGLYSTGTNPNSCANVADDAQTTSLPFANKGSSVKNNWYKNINRVGYTFNDSSVVQDVSSSVQANIIFGDNANYSRVNNMDSNIKSYLENIWFTNTIGNYESKLEQNAGYCNDRSIYNSNGVLLAEDVDVLTPYANPDSDITIYYFGPQRRNMSIDQNPSFLCPRGSVDIYTIGETQNNSGNGQLTKPVALLTVDEASFAGSGSITRSNGSGFNYNSYLRSGLTFWLMSPRQRYSNGYTYVFFLEPIGHIDTYYRVSNSYGVRPVVSLMHHIQVMSGDGTATSPWTISE